MRIVIVTPYWLQTKGGITTAVYSLVQELERQGYSVNVISPDGGPNIIKLPKNRFILLWRATRILWKIRPNVIHVHAHGSLLFPAVLYKVFLNLKVKLIFTFHTQPHTQFFLTGKQTKERGFIRQLIFNLLLKYCDATTFVSKSLMESCGKIGIKIINPVIIPNGVNAKPTNPEEVKNFIQSYNLIDNYPILCMVASFAWDWKIKGVMILIDAFKKILVSYPKARLVIVGDGNYRKTLEDYVKEKKLRNESIFTGNMENPFIALCVCDIYTHISLNEACPLAPLEAMIAGKPVIASSDAGLPEIISDGFNGILVNSNPEDIAKAILILLKDKNLMQELSRNAIITAKAKFSWGKITQEYVKLYEGT